MTYHLPPPSPDVHPHHCKCFYCGHMRRVTEQVVTTEMSALDMELAMLSSIYRNTGVRVTIRVVDLDAKFREPHKDQL